MLLMNHSPVTMHNDLEEKQLKGFFIQRIRIHVWRILFLDTKCSGGLYDCQNVLLNRNKSYECFTLKSGCSNNISMHSIYFSTDTGETKMMRKFRSLQILDTFTKGNLSVDICASRFQPGNDAYDDIVDAFYEIVDLVHSKGGWTVYWWYKRDFIDDFSLFGNDIKEPGDNKVLSQDISTHVVHLHPPKKDYIDLSTMNGRSLENLKFTFLHYEYMLLQ